MHLIHAVGRVPWRRTAELLAHPNVRGCNSLSKWNDYTLRTKAEILEVLRDSQDAALEAEKDQKK